MTTRDTKVLLFPRFVVNRYCFGSFLAVNIKTLNDRYCKVITCANKVAK